MRSVTAILAVLCLTHLHNVSADIKVHRKSIVATDKKLAFWIESYLDERLAYALCDDKHLQADEVKCTVIREKLEPYGNDTYSCDVILKRPPGPHNAEYFPHITVYPFGQKYAALTVWEGRELKFTVVQMDSCKVGAAALPYVSKSSIGFIYVAVVGHSDSFDVFFNNADLCGDRMCKATIGADGRIINEPKPSIKKFPRNDGIYRPVLALDSGSSENGYYYVTEDGNGYEHVLVKPDGTEKTFMRHPKPDGVLAVSKENNLLGVCYQMGDDLKCSQYDFDGNLKLNTTTTSGDKIRMYGITYNLPNGGFYVTSAECVTGDFGECVDIKRFLIERIDANGTKTGSIVFQGYDKKIFRYKVSPSLFYENSAKEVCISFAPTRAGEGIDGGRSEPIANCFTDADFAK